MDAELTLKNAAGRAALCALYRDALLQNCVPFWFPRSVDRKHGGFLHCLDRDGAVVDTDKSVWIQGRMSWMLLTLYNTVEKRPEWLQWAESGLKFLSDHCFDTDGRMFFHVTRAGRPIRKRRYAFSESFAAIAYAAHARATGSEASARRARELFDLFTRWNFTPGLMPPKFTDERPMIGLSPRMITIVTAQELRANLASLSPTGGERQGEGAVTAEAHLNTWIDRCIDEIRHLFVKPDLRVVMESVAPNGDIVDHFAGRTLNPGHAIEGAWFILHEGKARGDPALIRLGCDMLDWMWERGWDPEHGGLFYFRDVYGKPVQEYWHDMKFWWPHDEAIIATLLAHELTGDEKYARRHQMIHDWSFRHFADPEYGEWYGYLHRDGRVSVTLKGNLWKSFFHHPRMLWYCWKLLAEEPAV
jgi:N-acylglucosamine 2-epimerase